MIVAINPWTASSAKLDQNALATTLCNEQGGSQETRVASRSLIGTCPCTARVWISSTMPGSLLRGTSKCWQTHHPREPVNGEEQDAQGHAHEDGSFNDIAVPVGVHEGRCWAEVETDAHSLALLDRMRQLGACIACVQAHSSRQKASPQHKQLELLLLLAASRGLPRSPKTYRSVQLSTGTFQVVQTVAHPARLQRWLQTLQSEQTSTIGPLL